jgi:hypothetical protein
MNAPTPSPHHSDEQMPSVDISDNQATRHTDQPPADSEPPARTDEQPDGLKARREWIQLGLNGVAALAAVFLFFKYDGRHRALTNELTHLNTQIAAIERDLNNVALERSKLELEGLKGLKLEVMKTLETAPWSGGYKVDFQYVIKNESARRVEITNALAEVYVGTLHRSGRNAAIINAPLETGDVQWRNVFRRANVTFHKWEDGDYLEPTDPTAKPRHIVANRGGGGTGTLNPGESSQDGIALLVSAKKDDLIAVFVAITIDDTIGRTFGGIDSIAKPGSLR